MTYETNSLPRMRTIREVAKTGLLPEYCLRLMEKQGKLPCVYSGRKCLVNLDKLIEQLNNPDQEVGYDARSRRG